MNLELITNSKKYKYLKKSLKEKTYIYLGFFIFFSLLAIIMFFINESIMILSVAIIVFVSLMSFPFIVYYVYKLKKMVKDENSYLLMEGKISSVINTKVRYARITEITIYLKQLDKTFKTRVYDDNPTSVYWPNHYVKFLYNEKSKDIIVIGSIKQFKIDSNNYF